MGEKKRDFLFNPLSILLTLFFKEKKKGVFKEFGAEDNIYPNLTNLPFKE